MREIKFRGRAEEDFEEVEIKKGDWIYGDLVRNENSFWIVGNVSEADDEYISLERWTPVDIKTIGQLTGLKDKNGKEIYEGDIVLTKDDYTEPITDDGRGPCEPFNHLSPVIFKNGCFGVDIKESGDLFSIGFYCFEYDEFRTEDFEIIGNIYENKEIL